MSADDDDERDGCCDLDCVMAPPTEDGEQQDALVLFADVDFLDPLAVEQRRAEWEALL